MAPQNDPGEFDLDAIFNGGGRGKAPEAQSPLDLGSPGSSITESSIYSPDLPSGRFPHRRHMASDDDTVSDDENDQVESSIVIARPQPERVTDGSHGSAIVPRHPRSMILHSDELAAHPQGSHASPLPPVGGNSEIGNVFNIVAAPGARIDLRHFSRNDSQHVTNSNADVAPGSKAKLAESSRQLSPHQMNNNTSTTDIENGKENDPESAWFTIWISFLAVLRLICWNRYAWTLYGAFLALCIIAWLLEQGKFGGLALLNHMPGGSIIKFLWGCTIAPLFSWISNLAGTGHPLDPSTSGGFHPTTSPTMTLSFSRPVPTEQSNAVPGVYQRISDKLGRLIAAGVVENFGITGLLTAASQEAQEMAALNGEFIDALEAKSRAHHQELTTLKTQAESRCTLQPVKPWWRFWRRKDDPQLVAKRHFSRLLQIVGRMRQARLEEWSDERGRRSHAGGASCKASEKLSKASDGSEGLVDVLEDSKVLCSTSLRFGFHWSQAKSIIEKNYNKLDAIYKAMQKPSPDSEGQTPQEVEADVARIAGQLLADLEAMAALKQT